jgi:anti-sigma regulatory factor (Ser/Thr protein kinase)
VKLEARIENLESILRFVAECAGSLPWTENRAADIELVIEEAVVNICKYAYPAGSGVVELTCDGDQDSFRIGISDSGVAFDILSAHEPDLTADILEREVGGLGCFLIRTMTDGVRYRRDGGRNLLDLVFLAHGRESGKSGGS